MVSIQVIDEITRHVKLTASQAEAIKQIKLSETCNFAYLLKLKIDTQKMLTTNADIEDRLVDGLVGKVMQFKGSVCYIFATLFLSLNESTCQTRKNVFYFTSKALFVLEKIKF